MTGRHKRARRGTGVQPAPTYVDPGVLEDCLSLMLMTPGMLSPSERLALFRTCRGLARLVLRIAPAARMTFSKQTAAARNNRACVNQAFTLAAQASVLRLVMSSVLVSPPQPTWSRMRSICLDHVTIMGPGLTSLNLASMPHLKSLTFLMCDCKGLRGASFKPTKGRGSSASAAASPSSLQMLTVIDCTPDGALLPFLSSWLADSCPQLRSLDIGVTDWSMAGAEQLKSVRELHVHEVAKVAVCDCMLEGIASLQHLQEVYLPHTILHEDHSTTPVSWRKACLSQGVTTTTLARLPRVPHLALAPSIRTNGLVREALDNLARCESVECVPMATMCPWEPAEPTFHVVTSHLMDVMLEPEVEEECQELMPELISFVARTLTTTPTLMPAPVLPQPSGPVSLPASVTKRIVPSTGHGASVQLVSQAAAGTTPATAGTSGAAATTAGSAGSLAGVGGQGSSAQEAAAGGQRPMPCAFALGHARLSPEVLEALGKLPPIVTTFSLHLCSCFPLHEAASTLLPTLPAHTTHVVMRGHYSHTDLYTFAGSARRPLKLSFVGVESMDHHWENYVITGSMASGQALELTFFDE